MILYHGSQQIITVPKIRSSRYNKDFSEGFYLTENRDPAYRRSKRFGEKGYVNVFEYTPDPELKCFKFENMTDEWLDFIADCRMGQSHTFDVVEGPMVDDTIFNYVQNFIDGKISGAAFWELVKFKYPTKQVSFHTAKALNTLKYIGSEKVYGKKE